MKLYSKLRIVLLLTGAAALSACMVGPRYNKPEVTAPIEYKESSEWKIAQPRDAINRGPWWEVFGDPQLNALVQQVEVSNQTVRVAARAEVVLAQTQLRSTQAQLIDVGVQRAQLEHAIAILVGKAPADFALPPAPLALTVPVMPPGLPSELLERRPDIAAAERQMAAANAQIGVAQAAYFPTLTLNGVFGFRANTPQNWLVSPSRLWSVGPALAETLFDGGSRDAVKKQAEAAYDANVATYRQTVLNAFKEVEDNLSALRTLEAEAQTQDEAVQSSRLSTELTLNQYKAGTVNYLNVVTVQAMQHNNEATAVKILGQRLVAAVALVQALGGGWNGLTAAPTPR